MKQADRLHLPSGDVGSFGKSRQKNVSPEDGTKEEQEGRVYLDIASVKPLPDMKVSNPNMLTIVDGKTGKKHTWSSFGINQ